MALIHSLKIFIGLNSLLNPLRSTVDVLGHLSFEKCRLNVVQRLICRISCSTVCLRDDRRGEGEDLAAELWHADNVFRDGVCSPRCRQFERGPPDRRVNAYRRPE